MMYKLQKYKQSKMKKRKQIEKEINRYITKLSDEDFEQEYQHFIKLFNPLITKEHRRRKNKKLNEKNAL